LRKSEHIRGTIFVTVPTVKLLEQAITPEDHTDLLLRTAKVHHDLLHALFDCRSVNGYSALTIVYTDGHTDTKQPRMGAVWV
jgi:hypothetical protein